MTNHLPVFNVALPPDGTVPEWVELIPQGPAIIGRDGRHWVHDQPDSIVAAFQAHRGPLVIDWEHASELRARQGQEAPAAGWITELQNRAGAIWGKVEWTARARAQIEGREYRFLSPTFLYDRLSGAIRRLLSVGLTNQPNLYLTAFNRQEDLAQARGRLSIEDLEVCRQMGGDPTELARAKTAEQAPSTHLPMTAEEIEICRQFGTSLIEYLETKAHENR